MVSLIQSDSVTKLVYMRQMMVVTYSFGAKFYIIAHMATISKGFQHPFCNVDFILVIVFMGRLCAMIGFRVRMEVHMVHNPTILYCKRFRERKDGR